MDEVVRSFSATRNKVGVADFPAAAVSAIRALRSQTLTVRSLQDYYAGVEAGA